VIKITDKLMNMLSSRAKASVTKRCNYNFHNSNSDHIQRFLNVAEPDTYVRPHKHENPDKIEIFLILKGSVLVVEFNDDGKITDHIILDSEKGNNGVEISPKTWHSFIVLKEGPYIMETDKIFAEWAPEEGTKEAQKFNEKILSNLKIRLR
jgi:cupin fold WbuC family metalloprotein